jgi:hypothetical protein
MQDGRRIGLIAFKPDLPPANSLGPGRVPVPRLLAYYQVVCLFGRDAHGGVPKRLLVEVTNEINLAYMDVGNLDTRQDAALSRLVNFIRLPPHRAARYGTKSFPAATGKRPVI